MKRIYVLTRRIYIWTLCRFVNFFIGGPLIRRGFEESVFIVRESTKKLTWLKDIGFNISKGQWSGNGVPEPYGPYPNQGVSDPSFS